VTSDVSQQYDVVVQAHHVMAHHAKSFRLASLFLPKARANDAAVIYRFCRLVDDAVDEAPNIEIAHQEAERLCQELRGEKRPREEVAAYLAAAKRLDIPDFVAHDLMAGVCSDLCDVMIADEIELRRYCYRVAGTVGLMMCGVLGVRDPKAWPAAIDLGLGMQMTNIARDVLEDARRNRVYIPSNWLEELGSSSAEMSQEKTTRSVRIQAVDRLLEHAEVCYARARIGMHYIPVRARLAIFIALRVYRSIGLKLQGSHKSDPFHGRTIVSVWGKLFAVMHGIFDFCNPRTWYARKPPASSLYKNWEELRN